MTEDPHILNDKPGSLTTSLQEGEERFQLLFNNIIQGVVYQDAGGKIFSANKAAEKILGLSLDQMQGRLSIDPRWRAIKPDGTDLPGELHPAMVALRTGKEVAGFMMGIFNPEGEKYVWINVCAIPQFLKGEEKPYQVFSSFEDITTRKLAEDALRDSKEKYERVFRNSPNAIVVSSIEDGTIVEVNDAFVKLTGITRDEALGSSSGGLHLWADSADRNKVVIALQEGREVKDWEFRFVRKNGDPAFGQLSANIIHLIGKPHILSSITDITDRKKTEDELRENEQLLTAIFETAEDSIFIKNRSLEYVKVNRAMASLFELSKPEILGQTDSALFGAENAGHIEDVDREVLMGQTVAEYPSKPVRGTMHHFHTIKVPMKDAGGKITGLCGFARDITSRKKAEDELRKFRTISDMANYGSTIATPDGTLVYVNEALARMHGCEVHEMVGTNMARFYRNSESPRIEMLLQKVFSEDGFTSEEIEHTRKDGTVFPTLMSATLIRDAAGMPQFMSATVMDITEKKISESRIREQNDRLNAIVSAMPDLILIVDRHGCINDFYTSSPEKMITLVDQTIGTNLTDIFDAELSRLHLEMIDRCITEKKVVLYKYSLVFSGTENFFEARHAPLDNDQVLTLIRDITDREIADREIRNLTVNLEIKVEERTRLLAETNQTLRDEIEVRRKVEEALKIKSSELETFFNVALDLMCITDHSGRFIKLNKAWEDTLGYPVAELESRKFTGIIHPDDLAQVVERQSSGFIGSNHGFTARFRTKDGNYRTIEWRGVLSGDFIYAAARDITVRKKTESFEKELLDLSIQLTGIPVSEITGAINTALRRIGKFLAADRAYIFEVNSTGNTWSNTFEWCNDGITPEIDNLQNVSIELFPEWNEIFRRKENVIIADVVRLPALRQMERDVLQSQSIQSLIAIPMILENKLIGFVGLDSVACKKEYDKSEVNILKVWGNLLTSLISSRLTGEYIEQTRNNYDSFFNTIDDFLFVLDLQGNILYINDTVRRRLGYTFEELEGKSVLLVHPEERREEAGRIVGEMLAGTREYCPVPLKTKSGEYIPVETRVKTGFWNGTAVIFGVTKDVSDLRLSEEKFSKAFQSSTTLMAISTLEGKFLDVNNTFLKVLGYAREELIGQALNMFEHEDQQRLIGEKMAMNQSVRDEEVRVKTKTGTLIIGLFSGEMVTIGKEQFLLTMLVDITQRKQTEEEITRQAGLITSLLDSIPDIIFFKDPNGVYLGCNPPFAEFAGHPKSEIVGKSDYELFSREMADAFRYHDVKMIANRQTLHNEEWITYPNGSKVLVDTLKTMYLGADGSLLGVLGISRDITERKKAEVELMKAKTEAENANHAKSEFLSRMSHELRTPMNAILGYAQLLNMGELGPGQKKGVNHILKSGKHLLDLINGVLDIAGIEAGRVILSFEPVNLSDLVHEIKDLVHPMAREKNVSITILNEPGNAVFVRADKQRLNQVLINLLNNAVKYNQEEGKVVIQTDVVPGLHDMPEKARISITDTGTGIAAADIPKLFNPFERLGAEKTGTEGTGLGLAVVKRLINDLNGAIGVESELGTGSTFWIELPVCESPQGNESQQVPGSDATVEDTGHTGTVLYIEDNTSNIELVEQMLAVHRPNVRLICDMFGGNAVRLASEHKPDLVFLDIHLPDMTGTEVFFLLQECEITRNIPVIIISADAMPVKQNILLNSGVKNYFTKPFDIPALLTEMDKWMHFTKKNNPHG